MIILNQDKSTIYINYESQEANNMKDITQSDTTDSQCSIDCKALRH
jgi:hypothetical protein